MADTFPLVVFLDTFKTIFRRRLVTIDNPVCCLHHRLTFAILLLFSLIITLNQFLGDPMDCIHSSGRINDIDSEFIDSWCYIQGTYTVQEKTCRVRNNLNIPDRLGPYQGVVQLLEKDTVRNHTYYQWICLILFLQGVCFYIPHFLWKSLEDGHLKMLVGDLHLFRKEDYEADIPDESVKTRVDMLSSFLTKNLGNYNLYYLNFTMTECLNFVNVVAQLLFLDFLFGYDYLTFGSDIIRFVTSSKSQELSLEAQEEARRSNLAQVRLATGTQYDFKNCNSVDKVSNPLEKLFPQITKCEFKMYGPSGNIEPHDALCVLPLNTFNQKTYAFIWFWFIAVAVVTQLALLFRLFTFISYKLRFLLLKSKLSLCDEQEVKTLMDKINFGDWFILYQLSNNINPVVFKHVLHNVAKNISEDRKDK